MFALCASVVAQAAYVDWQLAYITKDATTIADWGSTTKGDPTGYTAYLLTADAYDGLAKTDGAINSVSDMIAASSGSASLNYDKNSKGNYYYTTGTKQATVDSTDTNYYILLSDGDKYTVAVSNASATPYADATGMGTGLTPNLTTSGLSAPASYTAFAPEPTSGILMLVGFGALALRRRRA